MGTMEYELITTAKANKKGGIIVKVIGVGNVETGVGSSGEWKKQIASLQDNSGTIDMVIWGDDIGKLDQGQYYKIENPYWSDYKNEVQLALGKYAKLHLANAGDLLVATVEDLGPQVPSPKSSPTTQSKLPTIPDTLKEFVIHEDDFLLQIGEIVENNHKLHGIVINGQRIGLHVKEIYREAKKTNLIKASDIKYDVPTSS